MTHRPTPATRRRDTTGRRIERRRRTGTLIAVGALTLAITGCGDDDQPGTAASTEAPHVAPSTAGQTTEATSSEYRR